MLGSQMNASTNESTKPSAPSVWCSLCNSNMLATPEVILAHFKSAHGRDPTVEEVRFVLSNTIENKFRGKKRHKSKKRKARPSYEDIQRDKERQDALTHRLPGSFETSKKR